MKIFLAYIQKCLYTIPYHFPQLVLPVFKYALIEMLKSSQHADKKLQKNAVEISTKLTNEIILQSYYNDITMIAFQTYDNIVLLYSK